jgi:hypothetical protein
MQTQNVLSLNTGTGAVAPREHVVNAPLRAVHRHHQDISFAQVLPQLPV